MRRKIGIIVMKMILFYKIILIIFFNFIQKNKKEKEKFNKNIFPYISLIKVHMET